MRIRFVLWSLAWLALFLVFTWAGSWAFVEVSVQDTFAGDSPTVYNVWWGRTLQWATGIATASVVGGLVLMRWLSRHDGQRRDQ